MSEQWPIMTLGEVIHEMKDGGTPKRSVPENFGGDITWCVVKDIKPEIFDSKEKLTQQGLDGSSAKLWPAGSIIISLGATIGKIGIARVPTATKQGLSGIVVNKELILAEFLVYLLHHKVKEIQELATGTTIKEVRPRKLMSELKLPVPSLEEQKRIVSILDEAFEKIEHNCIQLQTKITDAEDLFSSILYSEFSDNIETWSESELSEIAYTAGRIGWKGLTAKEYTDSGPLFLSVHSLNYGHHVDFRDANHISQQRYDESPEIMLESNDILICKDGAGIGKLGIINHVPNPSTINGSLLLIRASEKLVPKFLYYCLLSPYFQSIVQSRLEGSTTPHLYQRDIKQFPVRFPATSLQKEIVEKLDIIAADYENLLNNFSDGMKNFNELKQSILQEAFNGNL